MSEIGLLTTIMTTATFPERLEALFDAHRDRLFRLALRMTGDPEDARDLVQDSFLRAARSPGSLPTAEPAGEAWLVRTLVRLAKDRRRRFAVRRRVWSETLQPPKEADAQAPNPEGAAVARSAVHGALAELPPKRRAVVVLVELEERPVHEVAELLGVSRVTVRWHLSAGRKDLARRLAPVLATDDATSEKSEKDTEP